MAIARIADEIAQSGEVVFEVMDETYERMQQAYWFMAFQQYLFELGCQSLPFRIDFHGENRINEIKEDKEEACPYCHSQVRRPLEQSGQSPATGHQTRHREEPPGTVVNSSGRGDSPSADVRSKEVRSSQLAAGDELEQAHRCSPKAPK
ncbi:MAG: hypothetical protein NVS9B9_08570 [Ktedonobacteraceae bacterium]